jgi:drug/metabolite transporter, DME family
MREWLLVEPPDRSHASGNAEFGIPMSLPDERKTIRVVDVSAFDGGSNERPSATSFSGYFYVAAAATGWSLIGVFATYARRSGVTSLEIAFWRAALSAVGFALVATRNRQTRIVRRDLPTVGLFAAIGIALFNASLTLSIAAGGVSLAFMLLYSAPAFVMVLAWPLLREKLNKTKAILVLMILTGIAFVGFGSGSGVNVSTRSIVWGLISGASYSSFYLMGKPLYQKYSPATVFMYAMPVGALLLFPFVDFHHKTFSTWMWLIVLAAVSTLGAYLLYGIGIQRIEASRAVLVATVEPMLALVWGAVLFGERFGWQGFVGSGFIIAASLGAVLTD